MPSVGSCFAGIGGFELGFERAGFVTRWQVEIDPYCQKVLEKNFPHAERFRDIRECGRHNLAPVDVICGGFPCQDVSNAGLRAGIEGERSGLWSEMFRIVSELRPSYVVVENVAALLGRGIGRVLGDLSKIGYDAEWQVISAADMGAPHLRERVWIVAYPQCAKRGAPAQRWDVSSRDDAGREKTPGGFGEQGKEVADAAWIQQRRQEQRTQWERVGESGEPILDPDANRNNEYRRIGDVQMGRFWSEEAITRGFLAARDQWLVEPNVGRVAHGIPNRVDRLRCLGNAIIPQIAEMIARRIMAACDHGVPA
jgi:DNA (cytosine-5)-methyltransferase 1